MAGIVDDTPQERALVAEWSKRLDGLQYLYYYTGLRDQRFEWFEDTVLRSRIYRRRFDQLNDPFDGEVSLHFDADPQRIREYWEFFCSEDGRSLEAEREKIEQFVAQRDEPYVQEQM